VKSFKPVRIPPTAMASGVILFVVPKNVSNFSLGIKNNGSMIIKHDFDITGIKVDLAPAPTQKADPIVNASFTITRIDKEWYDEFSGGEFKTISLRVSNTGNADITPRYRVEIRNAVTKDNVFEEDNLMGFPLFISAGSSSAIDLDLLASVHDVNYYDINVTLMDEGGNPLFSQKTKELMN
jgi:hypothetical protein